MQPFNPKKLLYSDYAQLPEAREKELNAEYSSLEDLVKYASMPCAAMAYTRSKLGFRICGLGLRDYASGPCTERLLPWFRLVHGQASIRAQCSNPNIYTLNHRVLVSFVSLSDTTVAKAGPLPCAEVVFLEFQLFYVSPQALFWTDSS